jgi:hypothetical protein
MNYLPCELFEFEEARPRRAYRERIEICILWEGLPRQIKAPKIVHKQEVILTTTFDEDPFSPVVSRF